MRLGASVGLATLLCGTGAFAAPPSSFHNPPLGIGIGSASPAPFASDGLRLASSSRRPAAAAKALTLATTLTAGVQASAVTGAAAAVGSTTSAVPTRAAPDVFQPPFVLEVGRAPQAGVPTIARDTVCTGKVVRIGPVDPAMVAPLAGPLPDRAMVRDELSPCRE